MENDLPISRNEWHLWANYFGATFPTAPGTTLEQMTSRMIRTLSYSGRPVPMTRQDFTGRCIELRTALADLPDDCIQGGGDG